jgi:hypothetical protein
VVRDRVGGKFFDERTSWRAFMVVGTIVGLAGWCVECRRRRFIW